MSKNADWDKSQWGEILKLRKSESLAEALIKANHYSVSQVKRIYVESFKQALIETGLYNNFSWVTTSSAKKISKLAETHYNNAMKKIRSAK